MATLRGGLVIIDINGKLKYLFAKNSGLQDNNVKYVFEDAQGNLWAALEKGISKIEYSSPLSVYDEDQSQLPGIVMSVTRYDNRLYVGTTQGLYYMTPKNEKFSLVPEMSSMCWWLLTIDDNILAATSVGVFQIKNGTNRQIIEIPSYVLIQSRKNPNRVWVGMRNTLTSLYQNHGDKKGKWVEEYRYSRIKREIRTIVEDEDGNLWLGTSPSGVIKVEFPEEGSTKNYSIIEYNSFHQLPHGEVQVFWAAGHVMFGSGQGLFRLDKRKNIFIQETILGEAFSSHLKKVFRLVEDKNKTIWFHAGGQNYQALLKQDGKYDINEKSLARIPINAQVNYIFPDTSTNSTWFATHKGLIQYDLGLNKNYCHDYYTIIRRVILSNGLPKSDNLFMPMISNLIKRDSKHSVTTFDYNDRNFRFEFAAPFFEDESRTKYNYLLEGYDRDWSGFHYAVYKDYTNLDAGVYTFRVKSKNVYGNFSHEAIFTFKIQPPWYRTWWAYSSYVLMFFLTIFLTVRWRSSKLEQEKRVLSASVRDRVRAVVL
jgi:hypothetical protein